jgi:hypothetical protein
VVKAVKLLVEFTTERMWIQEYDGLDYNEARTHHVRTYPLIDIHKLARIISKDLEDIYLNGFGRILKFYEGSPDYNEIVKQLERLNPDSIPEIEAESLLEIEGPSTTYYMRRYLREYIDNRSARNRRFNGFTVRILFKDAIQAFKEIPNEFRMLAKECIEVLEYLKRYLAIQEHVHIRFSGDVLYTKQYVTEFLIETAAQMAPAYFRGCFTKDGAVVNLDGPHVYRPFLNRIEPIVEDSIDGDIGYVHREIFGRKINNVEYTSGYDSIYITIGGRILVPPLKEETHYLNKDYEMFSSLPNKFLIDGKIVMKEGADQGAKIFRSLVPLDLDFMVLGEAPWRPAISTEGFVLEARNLFAVNLAYIKDNLDIKYKPSHTMSQLLKESNSDSIFKALARSMPAISRDEKLAHLIRAVIANNLEDQIYDFLIKGMYQDYRYEVGADNLFNILQSKLFGVPEMSIK